MGRCGSWDPRQPGLRLLHLQDFVLGPGDGSLDLGEVFFDLASQSLKDREGLAAFTVGRLALDLRPPYPLGEIRRLHD